MSKQKVNYFDKREEDAVIEYIITDSTQVKHDLYNHILRKPLDKMVSSILRKYNNHIGNYNIYEVEADGLSHLLENMVKFRPFIIEYKEINNPEAKWLRHKKFRYLFEYEMIDKLNELNDIEDSLLEYRLLYASAYSYCGTIVRNFFKDHSKNSRNEIICNINLESSGIDFDGDLEYAYEDNYFENDDPVVKIFESIIKEIEDIIIKDVLNKNEKLVGYAIIEIFRNWDVLFTENTPVGEYDKKISNNFSKQKIFLILKEYTRMDLKEIRSNMKPFNLIYKKLKNDVLVTTS